MSMIVDGVPRGADALDEADCAGQNAEQEANCAGQDEAEPGVQRHRESYMC